MVHHIHPSSAKPINEPSPNRLKMLGMQTGLGLWTAWGAMALLIHKPMGMATYPTIAALTLIYAASIYQTKSTRTMSLVLLLTAISMWLYAQKPSNDRAWQDEVAMQLVHEIQGNVVTIQNVRNFEWISETDYVPRWQTRQYDLAQLDSLDLILSIWSNDNIAHTLMSFGFADGERVVFSFEIRKEIGEQFSSIGGFFRQYEMTLIAADEKDIIYTRSNVRGERVYLYPLSVPKDEMRALFLAYLQAADALRHTPSWYNTLSDNCTTAIFDLWRSVRDIPKDYRVLASGRLPEFLMDIGIIDGSKDPQASKSQAFINPKVQQYHHQNPITSHDFSKKIREDL
ncbi:DUF4105 domain-containing protein [Moraxella porci]|uniref:Lnb N-terminal periplasmic domain-containing protein n=1 Tax=Moraxella porci TaxID=1288392 RepID=UPI00244A019A|nr:DUF4105 domain-containing protein [Moraxella porci]MDH2273672.1 DUF4105 domain-containing protein [Moraxella porci]